MYCTGGLLRLLIHGLASIFGVGALHPARLSMDPSELVADDGQGDWSHDQVALETVCFEVAGNEPSTPSSPGSRRNVTLSLSRGTQEAPPLLLSPSASTPIRRVVSVFATDVCRAASPTVLVSTPPRRRAKTPQLPPAPRRSERLAKKSRHQATKPAQQAQNVLMKRLGLTPQVCLRTPHLSSAILLRSPPP